MHSTMKKEKLTKEIRVVVPPSLYNKFKDCCEQQYMTISEAVRQFMFKTIQNNKVNK